MYYESPKDIYSSMDSVWPDNDRWYNYTHNFILEFIKRYLAPKLSQESFYLNAGSGGTVYDIQGICHHVDIAENLICEFKNHTVASVENLPFEKDVFDAVICVGSVLNYCDAVISIKEISRVLKKGGYLVLEFERSNTGELLFTSEYGKNSTKQQYDYMGHTHTLWLYSEKMITQILNKCKLSVVKIERFHCVSALANRVFHQEEQSGKFAHYDVLFKPISYLLAHNTILLCKKL